MMKVQDVPKDIYNLLCSRTYQPNCAPTPEQEKDILARMGAAMIEAVQDAIGPDQVRAGRLRISGLGKPNRQVKMSYDGEEGEALAGNTRMKFLFGHITEALVLALTELSGHEVTEYQKPCSVAGIQGSQDCRIDGVLVDVKSASSFGFKKFKDGTMLQDDPFGYGAQIKGYAHQEGDTTYGWLVLDKQHGHLTTMIVDEADHPELQYDIVARAEELKKLVGDSSMPAQCYEVVPDGKSGNTKLGTGCSYCDYKAQCFPELRTFLYSTGPRYLTNVEVEPKVVELLEDF